MIICELCGEKPAKVKVKIETSLLRVCDSCASLGNVIAKIIPTPKSPKLPVAKEIEVEESLVEDYASRLREARLKAQMTQEEFAAKLNVNLAVLKAAEAGKRLDLQTAKKIEKVLKLKLVESL
ncbi:MAG: multiprotein-bridging factor 1 family protein [Candidatus Nanoarchaeia archaeon]